MLCILGANPVEAAGYGRPYGGDAKPEVEEHTRSTRGAHEDNALSPPNLQARTTLFRARRSSRPPLADRSQDIRHHFRLRLGAQAAFAVDADADGVGGHIARADDQHGVYLGQLGLLDLAVDLVVAVIALGADHVGAQLLHYGLDRKSTRLNSSHL